MVAVGKWVDRKTPPPLAHVHIVHKLPLNPEAKLEGKNEDVGVTRVVTFTTDIIRT